MLEPGQSQDGLKILTKCRQHLVSYFAPSSPRARHLTSVGFTAAGSTVWRIVFGTCADTVTIHCGMVVMERHIKQEEGHEKT